MEIYTTTKVATDYNVSRDLVTKWCKKNGVKIVGGNFIMSAEDVEAFAQRDTRIGRKRQVRQ